LKLYVNTPWATAIDTPEQVKLKREFSEKYKNVSKEISRQRAQTLKHYFSYTLKQSALNELEDRLQDTYRAAAVSNEMAAMNRVKFKPGGTPSKDRVIVKEKLTLTLAQLEENREYSHTYCRKNIEKIDVDLKERTQKLMLPVIKGVK
jgi:hypothetical protein